MSDRSPDAETADVVVPLAELVEAQPVRLTMGDMPVCVVRLGDDVFAFGDTCSHANVSLSTGFVDAAACEIECPKHGSMFSMRTGEAITLPATQPVPVFDVTVDGTSVTIRRPGSPDAAKGANS